jgi:hypothetical protein
MRGDPENGVLVPRAAILRYEGEAFVYVQTGDDTFGRKQIELERPLDNGFFVHEGLSANQQVVIAGAPALLSEEVHAVESEE